MFKEESIGGINELIELHIKDFKKNKSLLLRMVSNIR